MTQHHCLDTVLFWNLVEHNFSKIAHPSFAIFITVAVSHTSREWPVWLLASVVQEKSLIHEPLSLFFDRPQKKSKQDATVTQKLKTFLLCHRFSKRSRGRELVFRRRQQWCSVTGPADQSRLSPECSPSVLPLRRGHPERRSVSHTGRQSLKVHVNWTNFKLACWWMIIFAPLTSSIFLSLLSLLLHLLHHLLYRWMGHLPPHPRNWQMEWR